MKIWLQQFSDEKRDDGFLEDNFSNTHYKSMKLKEKLIQMWNEQEMQLVVVYDFQMMIYWWNQFSDEKRHNNLLHDNFSNTHYKSMKSKEKLIWMLN